MNIGIGLPAAVPDVDATTIGTWAVDAGRGGAPRIATGRYVSLGPDGAHHASEYLALITKAVHDRL
jgi:hypothetical protein